MGSGTEAKRDFASQFGSVPFLASKIFSILLQQLAENKNYDSSCTIRIDAETDIKLLPLASKCGVQGLGHRHISSKHAAHEAAFVFVSAAL